MTCFLSGGAKTGKSSYAQELTLSLAKGGRHYYVATMIPVDGEDLERIRLHLLDREGLGFETLECSGNLMSLLENADPEGAFLVDSATALLQNALFPPAGNYEPDPEGAERCARDLEAFARTVKNAVFVSDYIYSDAERYSESTEQYRRILAAIDRRLADACDVVMEVTAACRYVHKGGELL